MEGLQRIGFLHSDDFYLRKLQSLQPNSTVYIYRRYFEMLRSLVVGKYPNLDEEYFVSQCINGLKEDIKKVVQLFHPSTVEHVLSLATFHESIGSNKAKKIDNTASSISVSSVSIEFVAKHANDQMSVCGTDIFVIASSHARNGCTNDSDVMNSEIQMKSCEGRMPLEDIVITVDAENPISGTAGSVKCDSLAGLSSQYRWPFINSDISTMRNQICNLMVSPVQQMWSWQTHDVKVDQFVQDDNNAFILSTTLFQNEFGCDIRAIQHTTFVWESGPWLVIPKKGNHVYREPCGETTTKFFNKTVQSVMMKECPLSHRTEHISSIFSCKKGHQAIFRLLYSAGFVTKKEGSEKPCSRPTLNTNILLHCGVIFHINLFWFEPAGKLCIVETGIGVLFEGNQLKISMLLFTRATKLPLSSLATFLLIEVVHAQTQAIPKQVMMKKLIPGCCQGLKGRNVDVSYTLPYLVAPPLTIKAKTERIKKGITYVSTSFLLTYGYQFDGHHSSSGTDMIQGTQTLGVIVSAAGYPVGFVLLPALVLVLIFFQVL